MKRTTIFLTEKQVDKLKATAKASGLAMADLVRRAIDKFLTDPHERPKE